MAATIFVEYDGIRYDLAYSPDDGGWYFQRWADEATSEVYLSKDDAMNHLQLGACRFSK